MAVKEWIGTAADADYTNSANWKGGVVPIAGDDVFFKTGAEDVNVNINQSGVLLSSFNVEKGYTGLIGLTETFLQIKTPLLYLGNNPTNTTINGSQRINIDVGSVTACDIFINGSALTAIDSAKTPVRLLVSNVASNIFQTDGRVSVADDPASSSSLALIDSSGGFMTIGEAVTLIKLVSRGDASITAQENITTVECFNGTILMDLAATITTLTIEGGTVLFDSSGTVTTANVIGGILDYTNQTTPRTITTLNYGGDGAELRYDPNLISIGSIAISADFPITISTGKL